MWRWRQRLELCRNKPRNIWCHQKQQKKRFSPRPSEGIHPWSYIVFGLQASEGWECTSIVLSHQCMSICYSKGNEHRYLFLTVLFVKFQMYTHTHTHTQIHIFRFAVAKSLQSCLTLRDPIDDRPLGSPIPGILQARTLEWVALSFSNAWKWKWSCSVVSNS